MPIARNKASVEVPSYPCSQKTLMASCSTVSRSNSLGLLMARPYHFGLFCLMAVQADVSCLLRTSPVSACIVGHAVGSTPLSYRDVEDLRAERGVDVSCEMVRRWVRGVLSPGSCPSALHADPHNGI